MKNLQFAAPCGVYCEDCSMLKSECSGCHNIDGKPFWTKFYSSDSCPIYACCVNIKGLEHCGSCDELPCKTFTDLRDPGMSEEEYQCSFKNRVASLKLREKLGNDEWKKQD